MRATLIAAALVLAPAALAAQSGPAAPEDSVPAATAAVAEAPAAALPSLAIRGFIGATAFFQSGAFGFGNGQSALWVRAQDVAEDAEIAGADVRNSRLTLQMQGAELGPGMRASAVMELDFFGGFPGANGASDEQPLPRLRLAYADLTRGSTTLRVGQFWAPLTGNIPVSTTHIAYPLGLGSAGLIGWRNPGLGVIQSLGEPRGLHATLQLAAQRGSWNGPGDVLDQQSAGETSRVPQLEARVDIAGGERWSWYAVAHYDRKDLSGYGPDTSAAGTLEGSAVAVGAKLRTGGLTVHGNGYRGRAIGQHLGQLGQYGDIGSHGGWVQLGYQATSRVSGWVFAGGERVSEDDALQELPGDVRLGNALGAVMLQYAVGDYSAGVEWMHARTRWARRADERAERWDRSAGQLSFSVVYRFASVPAPTR